MNFEWSGGQFGNTMRCGGSLQTVVETYLVEVKNASFDFLECFVRELSLAGKVEDVMFLSDF